MGFPRSFCRGRKSVENSVLFCHRAGTLSEKCDIKYNSMVVPRLGGPEVLGIREMELLPPEKNQVRIRVLACSVTSPDLTVRRWKALYSGTPLGQKAPFGPGYAVVGEVAALGLEAVGVEIGQVVLIP